jgi:hypothetical protein
LFYPWSNVTDIERARLDSGLLGLNQGGVVIERIGAVMALNLSDIFSCMNFTYRLTIVMGFDYFPPIQKGF